MKAQTITLNNAKTAELYNCTFTLDMIIHVPGHYKGRTSDVPPEIAEILIQQHHPAFVRKPLQAVDAEVKEGTV